MKGKMEILVVIVVFYQIQFVNLHLEERIRERKDKNKIV